MQAKHVMQAHFSGFDNTAAISACDHLGLRSLV